MYLKTVFAVVVVVTDGPPVVVAHRLDDGQAQPVALLVLSGPVEAVKDMAGIERRLVRGIGHRERVGRGAYRDDPVWAVVAHGVHHQVVYHAL